MSPQRTIRRPLCRWVGWFFAANTLFYFCIGLNYLFYMPDFSNVPLMTGTGVVLSWVFMLSGLLGQSAVFAVVVAVPAMLLVLLLPKHWFAFATASLLAATMALFLLVDSVIYHLYHYHLAGIVWHIIRSGVMAQVLDLSWLEWLSLMVIALTLLAVEVLLAFLVWRWFQRKPKRQGGLVGATLVASLFLSYTLTLNAGLAVSQQDRSNNHMLVMEAQIIPYYDSVLGLILPGKNYGIKLQTRESGYFVQNDQIEKPLQYPLHPMQCAMPKKKYNIVVIALDAWRFDMLNPKVTPNIYRFAKKSSRFMDNISGGNATLPGIFSLFYSIPANYWTAFLAQHKSPVFIDRLLKNHYQMGIFASGTLHYPAFDETVFRDIKDLKINTEGEQSFQRDRAITEEFNHFIDHRDIKKPFFSFVFFDETHSYCDSSGRYPQPFQPSVKLCNRLALNMDSDPVPYLNRYRNAAHFDDHLVGKVLAKLKSRGLLQNTIVVITSDHGEEFNESKQNYWGHTGDYTPWQTHTPLVVYWPGKKPRTITYRTSHYDIVPTLMQGALGCRNPLSDYSEGQLLLNPDQPPFLLVNSYIDYAIVKPNRVTRIYPEGNYAINNGRGKTIPGAALNSHTLAQSFIILNRFFSSS